MMAIQENEYKDAYPTMRMRMLICVWLCAKSKRKAFSRGMAYLVYNFKKNNIYIYIIMLLEGGPRRRM